MRKVIRNANTVICKFEPALTRSTNHKLGIASKKKQKSKEIVERQKKKDMAAKYKKTKREISLFSDKEKNYENNIEHKINLE